MILGMSLATFTQLHVALSLVGILTGLMVLAGLLRSRIGGGATATFLVTTILTSATGFLFPVKEILPSHVVGIISLVALAIALFALYIRRLAGSWRWIYVVTAVFSLYLNCFVGVVQAFLKQPFLKPLAPTQTEPPFVIAQAMVLLIFVVLGFLAVRAFHPAGGTRALGSA
jgi:hypothetical protein